MDHPKIALKYFDARGRAQFLRAYFRWREIPFDDERVPLSADFSAWLAIRDDRELAGPFRKLPVIRWGDRLVAETTAILSFLHAASGDEAQLSEEDNLRHAMLASSAYEDLMLPIGTLVWADLAYAGVDLHALCHRTLDRIRRHMVSLDQTLAEWHWVDQLVARPVVLADCLLWEELSVTQHVFGEHWQIDETETLARFYRECPARDTFESLLAERPCQITGRPEEADAIDRIRGLLAAA